MACDGMLGAGRTHRVSVRNARPMPGNRGIMSDTTQADQKKQAAEILTAAMLRDWDWEWCEEREPLPGMDSTRWYARYRYSNLQPLPLRSWQDLPEPEGDWRAWKSPGIMPVAWVKFQNERYRRLRHDEGVVMGTWLWVREAMEMWHRNQCAGGSHQPADDQLLLRLAVGMRQNVAIRDALIVSTVGIEPLDYATLIRFAAEPSLPTHASTMAELLSEAFDSPRAVPHIGRFRASAAMLNRMVDLVPPSYRVQIVAILSYILWWADDPRTDIIAQIALRLDPDCTLASIVIDALRSGAKPEWCSL